VQKAMAGKMLSGLFTGLSAKVNLAKARNVESEVPEKASEE